jgi:hypothetical protein
MKSTKVLFQSYASQKGTSRAKSVSKKLHLLAATDYTRGYEYPTTIPD